MGMKAPPARSTLADALNQRDWRTHHALASAKTSYAKKPSALELDINTHAYKYRNMKPRLSRQDGSANSGHVYGYV